MPPHPCAHCGSLGPFYPSQPSWCIACVKAYQATRYAANRLAICTAVRKSRLRTLRRMDPWQLTRRQRHLLMRQDLPPGYKLCPHCETAKTPGWFRTDPRTKDGRDYLCRQCRRELEALKEYKHRRRLLTGAGREESTRRNNT